MALINIPCEKLVEGVSPSLVQEILPEVKRGDIIYAGEYGKFIWDSDTLLPLHVQSTDNIHPDLGECIDQVTSVFCIGNDFLANHWIEYTDNVWIDIPLYREELLTNLSLRGTSFCTSLGTFTIKVDTHCLYMARMSLRKIIEDAVSPVSFTVTDSHTVVYTYSMYDELTMLYPDYKVFLHKPSDTSYYILTRDTIGPDSILYIDNDGSLIPCSYEEYTSAIGNETTSCGDCCRCSKIVSVVNEYS